MFVFLQRSFVRLTRKRIAIVFVVAFAMACGWLPRSGFSEDERVGLYAGPLSVAVETLVDKVKSPSKDAPEQSVGAPQRYRGETGISKKQTTKFETESPLSSPSDRNKR